MLPHKPPIGWHQARSEAERRRLPARFSPRPVP